MQKFRNRRAWAVVATVALAAGLTPALFAGAASAATAVTVHTDDEFFDAWVDSSVTQIDLANDISLTQQGNCGTYPERNQTDPTLVDGHGFTLTQTCDDNSVLYVDEGTALLTVQNITLTHTGAPSPTVFGSGIWSDGPVTVLNSTITGNWANGGACSDDVSVVCLNSSVGGGIGSNSDVIVDGSTITNNRADQGGGIYSGDGTVTVTGSTIRENSAEGSDALGGGIYSDGPLSVTGSTLADNEADGKGYAYGGGAFTWSGGTIDGTTFDTNQAFCPGECSPGGGGLASQGGDVDITSSNFLGNTASCELFCDNVGGGILTGLGSLTVTGSLITQNGVTCEDSCESDGGGIFAQTDPFFEFSAPGSASNDVQAAGRGFLASITDSTVSNNTALVTDTESGDCDCSGAGAVFVAQESLTVTRSTFSNNTALYDGGAMDIWSEFTQVRIENSTITGNQSSYDGAVDAWDSSVTTVYSTIDGNILNEPPANLQSTSSNYRTHGGVHAAEDIPRPANLSAGSLTTFATVFADPKGGPNCVITGEAEEANSEGSNFSDDTSCGLTNTTDGDRQNAGSPMLNVLAENGGPTATMMPYTPKTNGAASPLIDAIPAARCQAGAAAGVGIDQRGVTRPQIVGCDIGAVEVTDGEYQVEAAVVQPKFTG